MAGFYKERLDNITTHKSHDWKRREEIRRLQNAKVEELIDGVIMGVLQKYQNSGNYKVQYYSYLIEFCSLKKDLDISFRLSDRQKNYHNVTKIDGYLEEVNKIYSNLDQETFQFEDKNGNITFAMSTDKETKRKKFIIQL